MNTQMLFLIIICLVFIMAVFSTNKVAKTVHCRYVSRSKQSIEKDISLKASNVIFEKKKFNVIPSCVTTQKVTKGIHALFPTTRRELSYVWNSPNPIDPNTGEPVMLSPEVEKALDQEGALGDYAGSQNRALAGKGGKGGMLDKLMPIMMIVCVLAVVFLVYTHFQDAKNAKVTQTAISDIYNTLNANGTPVQHFGK
jgi:preprotein translocase subunit SecG